MRAKYLVFGVVIGLLLTSAVVVLAGNLDPPSGPSDAASQMYTLEQIYNRVNDGTAATKMTEFTEPSSGPGSTMHTLDQLYSLVGLRAPVPKTGQTESYADGDDGDLQKGVLWPRGRLVDNGDGTVTDSLTGLMWIQDALCMSTANWENMLARIGSLNSGTDHDCANYTAGTYGDWRMPNRFEMESLMDLSQSSKALPSGHPFISVISADFWTSTTLADDPLEAWFVDTEYGDPEYKNKGLASFALPVRGGQ